MQLLKKLVAAVLAAVIFIGFYQPFLVSAYDISFADNPYSYAYGSLPSDSSTLCDQGDLKRFKTDLDSLPYVNTFYFMRFRNHTRYFCYISNDDIIYEDSAFLIYQIKEYSTATYNTSVSSSVSSSDSYLYIIIDKTADFSSYKSIACSTYYSYRDFDTYVKPDLVTLFNISSINSSYYCSAFRAYPIYDYLFNKTVKVDKVLYGVRLGVDKDSFTEWIINNNKLNEIKAYWTGATIDNIDKIIEWWSNYNHSPALAFIHLPELFGYFADVGYTVDDVADLYSLLKSLYFEYQDYLLKPQVEAIYPDDSRLHLHHRGTLDDGSDSDFTLVTDQDDDSTVISLLREILRVLINLPKDISTFFNYLPNKLDIIISQLNSLIDFNNSFPDSLAAKIHSAFSSDIDDLIAAIGSSGGSVDVSNNISVDNFIDVTVPDQKQKEINEFFTDWNITFSDKINSKFPAAAQLGDIFNDQFFEKCGIDVNGDGEVFEYYSADAVLSPETSLSSPEGKFLTQFLNQFDNADPAFLDNVSFSEDVPDLTVSISGQKCSIFDFRIYAKYRTEIHGILTFILFITYFLSLYKSFPSVVGRVSDVVHSFRTDKEV